MSWSGEALNALSARRRLLFDGTSARFDEVAFLDAQARAVEIARLDFTDQITYWIAGRDRVDRERTAANLTQLG